MRICVLDEVYDCPAWEAPPDDWRVDPTPFLSAHDWVVAGLAKDTAVAQLNQLSRRGFDLFFNLCGGAWDEGSPGIEVVQTLERLDVPFTGASSRFYEPSREAMKRVCSAWGIGFPDYVLARTEDDIHRAARDLSFPLIVKHPSSYSSIDLMKNAKVAGTDALRRRALTMMEKYGAALIEEFIQGREFTVLVAENPDPLARPVTYVPVEFVFPEGESFKHSDLKWYDYHDMEEVPLPDGDLASRLREVAADFFTGMRGTSFGRCDIRMDAGGHLFMLEINPNCGVYYAASDPGSADLALLNDPAGHQGFTDLLLESALARHARKRRAWETRPTPGNGYAVFATRSIPRGETVLSLQAAALRLVTQPWLEERWGRRDRGWLGRFAWPITETIWASCPDDPEEWRPFKHSCDPNLWPRGWDLLARKEIQEGEELRVDFATLGTNLLGAFPCRCGATECRGRVLRDDHLQSFMERYGNHLSEFVQLSRSNTGI